MVANAYAKGRETIDRSNKKRASICCTTSDLIGTGEVQVQGAAACNVAWMEGGGGGLVVDEVGIGNSIVIVGGLSTF